MNFTVYGAGRSLWRRSNARIAALILQPGQAPRAVIACIIGYTVLLVLILTVLKFPQDLFMDSTEAYAWGRQFLGGYGRHPPMTGWIAGVWYRVFPAANWSSYALSHVMVGISLVSIYLIARRVLDTRRAAFVAFIMMLYPLFHLKSDRFSNYQVELTLLPLLVLVFLQAFERRSALWGALLGLVAAAATLTIYSGLIGVFAIGLAALLSRDRGRLFFSPAPYCAVAVFLVALSPHIVWLIERDFSSLRWAESQAGREGAAEAIPRFFYEQALWYAMPLAGAVLALWPVRWNPAGKALRTKPDAFLVTVICAVLVAVPPLLAIPLHVPLKAAWGNGLFFLIPIVALLLVPRLQVTRRSVASSALVAGTWLLVMLVAAPFYPWLNFRMRPDSGSYIPTSELATEVTRLWRERYGTPLPLVVSNFDLATAVTFYSPDHPRMYADFNPAFSPWIDYPAELHRKGFVAVCREDDRRCEVELDKIAPEADSLDLAVSRKFEGIIGKMLKASVRFARPGF
jgi:4-amino-4-deoxy-L-arabinose transferase-like glycosyltransferase